MDIALEVSEEIVESPAHKTAGTSLIDFDGLLKPPLQLHEDLKEGCGGQLWPAGMLLTRYLLREDRLGTMRNSTILELGAGGGLVGLAIAKALIQTKESTPCRSHIHITDQGQLLSLMKHNILLNQLPPELVEASVLDWGSPWSLENEQPDMLLAADCVYFEPSFPLLLQTMKQLIGPSTICWFCFKKRRRADLRFMKDAKKLFLVEEVMDDPSRETSSREGLFLYKILMKRG